MANSTASIRLYLDIDGVFLGKSDPAGSEIVLARHAEAFVEFALGAFECYWLTTHCRGETAAVLDYLRPYCGAALLRRLAKVRPTSWQTLKTEALESPFFWVDDSPLAVELEWLKSRGLVDRWIQVDTRKRPDDLLKAIRTLSRQRGALATGGPAVPPAKAATVSRLIVEFEDTRDPEVLTRIVDRYCEYQEEEPIEWMEDTIDASPESEVIYRAINQRYIDRAREHLGGADKT